MEKPIQTISLAVIAAVLVLGLGYCIGRHCGSMRDGRYMKKASMMHGPMMNHSGMKDAMEGMTMGLQGKTGSEFDKAFIDEMIMHHEGAVEMAKQVLEKSERAELKKLAEDIITAQTKEIEMMKTWQAEWSK